MQDTLGAREESPSLASTTGFLSVNRQAEAHARPIHAPGNSPVVSSHRPAFEDSSTATLGLVAREDSP
ncbi:protein of unknown function [Agreia sp. COWG]|nr:protein of unknown function [Agreia sp. COWG]